VERIKKYLKFAALIPAILLVGAFVGCRSGAFHLNSKPEPKTEILHPPTGEPTLMPGSKSIQYIVKPDN
jgi:hypothetical protein